LNVNRNAEVCHSALGTGRFRQTCFFDFPPDD
jgi:hypothetical protein